MAKRMMEEGNTYKKGLWTKEEDKILMDYIKVHGEGKWNLAAKKTGWNVSLLIYLFVGGINMYFFCIAF